MATSRFRTRAHGVLRASLIVVLAGLVLVIPFIGAWKTSVDHLEERISTGAVNEISLVEGTDEVQWRQGVLTRYAEVARTVGEPQRLIESWKELYPGLEVTTVDASAAVGEFDRILLPQGVTIVLLLTGLVTFLRVIGGPEPVRANRWAWFWVSRVPLVGELLFWIFGARAHSPENGEAPRRRYDGWSGLACAIVLGFAGSLVLGLV